MQYGFTFNNIHSSQFGITVKTKNKPIFPTPKRIVSDIPTRCGVLDYSEANPYGHILFDQREITVDCAFVSKNLEELRKKVRAIAAWLAFSEEKLYFDDEPEIYYLARVSNRLDLEQHLSRGHFAIVFSCRPYAYSIYKSGVIHSYGEGFLYDGTVSYGGDNAFMLKKSKLVTVYNKGYFVRPVIKIEGSFEKLSVVCNKRTLTCNSPQTDATLVIDCEKMTAVKNNSTNALPTISGKFVELKNGENSVNLLGTNLDCIVTFEFNYLYI